MATSKHGPKLGLALGSGGAKGWCHIGAVRALKEAGVEPDIVAGCSMGALVGAAYVTGTLDELEAWATSINWRKMASYVDVNLVGGGIIEGRHIIEFLESDSKSLHLIGISCEPSCQQSDVGDECPCG